MNTGTLVACVLLLLVTLLARGSEAQNPELLRNGGFEGSYGQSAPGWTPNTWPSDGEGAPAFRFSRSTDIVHSGNSSQRIQVTDLPSRSGVALWQGLDDEAGTIYEYRLWVRSHNTTVKMQVLFRQPKINYRTGGTIILNATPQWQEVVIRGGFERKNGTQVGVTILEPGTVYLDDASVRDVTHEALNDQSLNLKRPVPANYFGLHILKLGEHNVWPNTHHGLLRLWNTGTYWPALEKAKGNWSLGRLEYYLRHTRNHAPNCTVMLTLGMTPLWAASDPSKISEGYNQTSTSPPKNLDDWRQYVRKVAESTKGQVRHFEIWNEVDIASYHWSGSVSQMIELTRIAREEIKDVDPNNVIVSPDATSSGLGWMAEFLYQGGAQYIDILSMHLYPLTAVELSLPIVHGMHTLRKHYGLMDKPIWLTEGSPGGRYGIPGDEINEVQTLPDDVIKAAVGRVFTLLWSYGIESYHWYFWEHTNSSQVPLSNGRSDRWTETALGGDCYREMVGWLRGAQLESKSRSEEGQWQVNFVRPNGRGAAVIWMFNSTAEWSVPENWGNPQLYRLTEPARALFSNETLEIGIAPMMVEYDRPESSSANSLHRSVGHAATVLAQLLSWFM